MAVCHHPQKLHPHIQKFKLVYNNERGNVFQISKETLI